MTIPYNASSASIIEYIKDNFDKQRERNPNFKGQDAPFAAE